MKLYLLIPSRRVLAMLCGMAFTVGLATVPTRADQWDKKTILTVRNQPVQIRDTVLEPGEYVLRLLDSPSERHVVQIFNRDQTHIINTILAVPALRMEPGPTQFTFWETPPGSARAMREWFYPGDTIGQEFPYPQHLQQIAMLVPPAPAPPAAAPEPEPSAAAEPAPQETPAQPEAAAPEPAPEQQPTEVAQNAAPAPAEPQPEPTPAQPAELPKTSSPYPLIGLAGGVMLGLYLLLRLRLRISA